MNKRQQRPPVLRQLQALVESEIGPFLVEQRPRCTLINCFGSAYSSFFFGQGFLEMITLGATCSARHRCTYKARPQTAAATHTVYPVTTTHHQHTSLLAHSVFTDGAAALTLKKRKEDGSRCLFLPFQHSTFLFSSDGFNGSAGDPSSSTRTSC